MATVTGLAGKRTGLDELYIEIDHPDAAPLAAKAIYARCMLTPLFLTDW